MKMSQEILFFVFGWFDPSRQSATLSRDEIDMFEQGQDQRAARESAARDWDSQPDQQPTDCQVPRRLRELE